MGHVTNFDRVVEFTIDGVMYRRRLVHRVEYHEEELNMGSPVGQALAGASPGEQFTVKTPGGSMQVEMVGVVG